MLLKTFRTLQGVLFLMASFFLYQSATFFYHSLKDYRRGENGVTKGLMFLSGGLTLAGVVNVIETAYKLLTSENE